MGVLQSLKNVFTPGATTNAPAVKQAMPAKDFSTRSNFSQWFGRTFFGLENSTLETNENIFSVVSRLANTVSSLPFNKYKNYEALHDADMDRLLYEPNTNQTLDQIFNVLEVARNTNGNGYALIMRDIRGQLDKIVPINPIYVEPVQESESRELWYRVTNDAGETYFFYNMDVIHVRHIAGNGNLKGISPLYVLKNSNDFDKAVREFSLREMQNIRDSFILKYDASVDDEKRAAVIEDFKRFYDENGGILFQEPGVTIEEMTRKFVPGDIQISEKLTRDRIANVYNVPSIFLNSDSQSFSSNEQLMQLFVNMTLTPIIHQYEREFNRKLLLPRERLQGYRYKFNFMGLLRGDLAARQAFYHGAIRDGYMAPDEVRMHEELPPKGGKAAELWISGDMYPQEMEPGDRNKTSAPTAPTIGPAPPDNNQNNQDQNVTE